MAQFKHPKKAVTLIVAAGLTLAGTGVAVAYWTSTGRGSGAATTGSITGFTVSSEAPAGTALSPGSTPGQTVAFTVTNPSTSSQNLTVVTVAVANSDGSAWTAVTGCSAADYAVSITSDPTPATILPSGNVSGTATITMKSLVTNQDACQGKTVPLYFTAS